MEKVIEKRQEVIDFLQVDECLNGKGFGRGNDYSDGDNYGNGAGFGKGHGYGDECGNGFGCGRCYEFKDGCGNYYNGGHYSEFSNGCGYGHGYGDNTSIKVVKGVVVHTIDGIATLIESVHGNFAKGYILKDDLTINSCYIAKCGNYFAHGETLEDAFHYAREKYEENLPIKERIARFNEQYPDRNKKVPANELFNWHHTLTGSCLIGRKHFCKERKIDYENGEYSVNEFIQLTKNAYNGDIIRQLESSL